VGVTPLPTGSRSTSGTTYRQAIATAVADELAADQRTVVLGVRPDAQAGDTGLGLLPDLLNQFGPDRVRVAAKTERTLAATAAGAAMAGLRPIVDLGFGDLAGSAFEQLVHGLASYRYLSGGQVTVPLTVLAAGGAGVGYAAGQSSVAENWFTGVPGLKVAVPSTAADAYALLRNGIRDDNPTLVFAHQALLRMRGAVPTRLEQSAPWGQANVVRRGSDVTIVATQLMLHRSLEAAEILAGEGVQATVIDPRTLTPFDEGALETSLSETSKLVVVSEAPGTTGWAARLIARLLEHHFFLFDAPPLLIAAEETPVPYAHPLETAYLPSVERIVSEVKARENS
jgi:acetoin:2,6-dichlorophenolindophenol oxidoreductase subunit beta